MCCMKRLICISLLGLLIVICTNIYSSNLLLYCNELGSDYSILECDSDCTVIEIKDVDLWDVVNKLNVEIVDMVNFDGRVIVEGYSSLLSSNITNGIRKINIQLSSYDNNCIIGTPLIKGSF